MRKPSERQCFPHLEDLLAVYPVPEERVACGVCGRTVRRRERLHSRHSVHAVRYALDLPHLRGDVVVKVARILGMTEFGTVLLLRP